MNTLRLLLCVSGLLKNVSDNYGNHSYSAYGSGHGSIGVSNGTYFGVEGEASWLRDIIRTRAVPVVCVFGVVGNVLTLVVLASERLHFGAGGERKVSIWLQALAVSDLLLCVVLLPHGLMSYDGSLLYTSFSFQLLFRAYGSAVINNLTIVGRDEESSVFWSTRSRQTSAVTGVNACTVLMINFISPSNGIHAILKRYKKEKKKQ